jgi:ABC-type branched-subunit amino acid transport system substrate-binding protein
MHLMHKQGKFRLLLALFLALALVAAACGDDDDTAAEDTEEQPDDTGSDGEGEGELITCPTGEDAIEASEPSETPPEEEVPKTENVGGDGVLDFGTLLPETGDLAFLGPPEFAGVDLAVQDINAGGGVLDSDVTVSHGDSGDTSTDLASQEATRLLNAGVDAIIGAASSGVSLTVIDQITDAGVIQFSPANTSPSFTEYDDGGLYFRTAPSDVLQGRVLSDLVLADGFTSVAVMARDDDYGVNLLESFSGFFEDSGGEIVESFSYDQQAQNFDAEIDQVTGANPEAIVLIGFQESAQIISGLEEAGFGPNDVQMYGTDGNMGNSLAENFNDPTVLTCMKGTIPLTELGEDFQNRLLEINPNLVDFSYAAESYDATVITALAAAIAGTDDSTAIAAEINGVTREGEKCTTFEECKTLIDGGTTDIDYDGVGGPYEFIDAGEPGAAVFAIPQFDAAGALAIPEYQQAEL